MPKKADLDAAIRRGKEQEKIRKQQAALAAAEAAKVPPLVETLPEAPKPKKEKKPKKKYDAASRDARINARGKLPHKTKWEFEWDNIRWCYIFTLRVPTGDDAAPLVIEHIQTGEQFRGLEALDDKYREYLKSKGQPPPAG